MEQYFDGWRAVYPTENSVSVGSHQQYNNNREQQGAAGSSREQQGAAGSAREQQGAVGSSREQQGADDNSREQ